MVLIEKSHGQRILGSYHTTQRRRAVTTEDFIISLFCLVDDRMGNLPKHSDARLYPSELVTIGLLYVLKGGFFRAFYRWLKRDYETLFVTLPDRTRIQRPNTRPHPGKRRATRIPLVSKPNLLIILLHTDTSN